MVPPPDLLNQANTAARNFGVPSDFFDTVIGDESSWNPSAVNPSSGAFGLGQFMPGTAGDFNLTPGSSTQDQLNASASYLSQLFHQTGSWQGAIARYTNNPVGVEPYTGSGQTPVLPMLANLPNTSDPTGSIGPDGSYVPGAATVGSPAAANANGSVIGNAYKAITGFNLASWVERIGVVVLGIGIILVGLMLFPKTQSMVANAAKTIAT